jgi:phosphodiesterase/alkaline phosphatase D-like protein
VIVGKRAGSISPTIVAMNASIDDDYPRSDTRRRWLQVLSATALAQAAAPANALSTRGRLAFAPAAFDAADSRVLIAVWGVRADRVHVRCSTDRADASAVLSQRSAAITLSASANFAAAIELTGVRAGATIYYAVCADDSALSDVQSFRMPPEPTSSGDFALAFSGDIEARYRPFHVFDQIAKRKPDAFLMLGDTVYADIPKREFSATIAHYRRKHAEIRSDRSLQSFFAHHAGIATWDDHEIENGSNGMHPGIRDAEQVFREYWPCRTKAGVGLYRHMKFGRDIELFVLDTRRFRSPQTDADGEAKTMLGAAQKAQFKSDFAASNARYRLIASSVPLHGSSQDAWGNYAAERDELLAMFRAAYVATNAKTIVLSGDYHFAREWPRNEKRGVYEFTAGPLAAFLPFEKDNAVRVRHSRGEHFVFGDRANFGMLRYDAGMRELRLFYYDDLGRQLFHRQL